MSSDGGDPVDPVALAVAARAQRRSIGRLVRLVLRSLPVVWRAGRGELVLLLFLQVAGAAALALQVLVVRDVLEAVLGLDRGLSPTVLYVPVLLLAGLTALASVLASVQGHLQRHLGERVARAVLGEVIGVATRVSLAHFESADFFNRLDRVQTNALNRPYQVSQGLITTTGALTAGAALAVALAAIHPVLLPLVVLGGLPVLLGSRREARLEFDFAVRETPGQRMRMYLGAVLTGRHEAKEIRAFGTGPWLRSTFDGLYGSYLARLATHLRRRALAGIVGQLGAALVLTLTLAVLVVLIVAGRASVAETGAAIVAIRLLVAQVNHGVGGVQGILESGLFLDDLDEFFAIGRRAAAADGGGKPPSDVGVVEARAVTFTYPDGGRPALREVSVRLRGGEVVALVGENGSGKTTLAKVLTGLYQPDQGTVLWDGVDLRSFRPSDVHERSTVVFQDFVRYAMSAEENIALGPVVDDETRARVREAAKRAGVDDTLDRLPSGYQTLLSRMFPGGRDLSGGEWQRVALARAFFRDAPLVVLDEPSASLDPRAEHELFTRLRSVLRGRTALFISHRFSTVRGADRIYVLAHGRVVESGTHDELIAARSHYADLYRLQSEAYVATQALESEVRPPALAPHEPVEPGR